MFHGTTIDELFDAVVRAECHARLHPSTLGEVREESGMDLMPGFLYELAQTNAELVGVA